MREGSPMTQAAAHLTSVMTTAATIPYQWRVVTEHWRAFLAGAWIDVWVAVVGFGLACVLGLGIALMRTSRLRVLSVAARVWTQVFRGVPGYVLLLWLYFGLAYAAGWKLSPIQAVIAALTLAGSAYTSEAFRAGVQSIDLGQFEAARAIALSRAWVYRSVIFPQAMRVMVPPLGNILVGTLKAATIMSVIAIPDMVFVAQDLNYRYFTPFPTFTAVAVLLVLIVFLFSALVAATERLVRIR
jgi:His/Glu/Gln/Arg/opine family amino acid ABC transporter permease subunit